MPPLPPAPLGVRVKLSGTNQTLPWVNILFLQYSGGPPTGTDLTTLASAVRTAWTTNVAPAMHAQVALTGVDCQDIASTTGASGSWSGSAPGTGSGTAYLPVNVAICVSWKVSLRWRGGHPRNYWPGTVQTNVSAGNQWLPAYLTILQTAAANFHTALNALTLNGNPTLHVVYSYYHGNALRPTPIPMVVNSTAVHPRVDTMRRRLGKEH